MPQLYAPMAGTQLSSSMVQPQNPNCLVGSQLLNTMVLIQLLNIIVGPQTLNTMVLTQLLNIMVNPNFSTPWSELNFYCLPLKQTTQLSAYIVHSQLPTDSFWKSSNPQDHRFRVCHSLSSPIFYLGFIMTIVIVMSFAHERKTVPNDCAPELRAE